MVFINFNRVHRKYVVYLLNVMLSSIFVRLHRHPRKENNINAKFEGPAETFSNGDDESLSPECFSQLFSKISGKLRRLAIKKTKKKPRLLVLKLFSPSPPPSSFYDSPRNLRASLLRTPIVFVDVSEGLAGVNFPTALALDFTGS